MMSAGSRRRPGPWRWAFTLAAVAVTALSITVATGLHPAMEPSRYDQQARRALSGGPVSPEEVDRLSSITRRSLARRPLDGAAQLRLAYLTVLRTGGLDAQANEAVVASYGVEPLGSEISLWRIGFGFDNWSTASPPVRRAVLNELAAVYPRRSWDLDAIAGTTSDPQGRMVALIATRRLRRALETSARSGA